MKSLGFSAQRFAIESTVHETIEVFVVHFCHIGKRFILLDFFVVRKRHEGNFEQSGHRLLFYVV